MTATQHRALEAERVSGRPFDEQILMIGNEMNRAAAMLARGAPDRARGSYERVLALVDLVVAAAATRARRRELLRWREVVAALYVAPAPDPAGHRQAFRALLQTTPASATQIPLLPALSGQRDAPAGT